MYSKKTTETLKRIQRLRTLQHSQFCSAKEEQHMYSSKTTDTLQRIYRPFSILKSALQKYIVQQQDHKVPAEDLQA